MAHRNDPVDLRLAHARGHEDIDDLLTVEVLIRLVLRNFAV